MNAKKTSAQLVERLYEKFAANARRTGGLLVSKREVSTILLDSKDSALLSRWINPGGRPKWVIPLARIPETCEHLGATPDELDELMLTRLGELADTHPNHEAFSVLNWYEDFAVRAGAIIPSTDELIVLEAYRTAAKGRLLGLQGTPEEKERLRQFFAEALAEAEKNELEEQAPFQEEELTPLEEEEMEQRLQNVMKMLKGARDADVAKKNEEQATLQKHWRKKHKGNVSRVVMAYLKDIKNRIKQSQSNGK